MMLNVAVRLAIVTLAATTAIGCGSAPAPEQAATTAAAATPAATAPTKQADPGTVPPQGAFDACDKFWALNDDAEAGIITDTELRARVQELRERAADSRDRAPEILKASTAFLADITQGRAGNIKKSQKELATQCLQLAREWDGKQ